VLSSLTAAIKSWEGNTMTEAVKVAWAQLQEKLAEEVPNSAPPNQTETLKQYLVIEREWRLSKDLDNGALLQSLLSEVDKRKLELSNEAADASSEKGETATPHAARKSYILETLSDYIKRDLTDHLEKQKPAGQ
jgi:hypothetical protein